jgi:hypothetical protein
MLVLHYSPWLSHANAYVPKELSTTSPATESKEVKSSDTADASKTRSDVLAPIGSASEAEVDEFKSTPMQADSSSSHATHIPHSQSTHRSNFTDVHHRHLLEEKKPRLRLCRPQETSLPFTLPPQVDDPLARSGLDQLILITR